MSIHINQKIILVTHELVYGVPQALKDYLIKKKCGQLLFIGLPFFVSRKASVSIYKKGQAVSEEITQRPISFGTLDYFLDFLYVLWSVMKTSGTHDVFIGVNVLNCLAGLLLRKVGKVKKVVLYTMDFVPVRFENRLMNYIFHSIEIVCVKHSDEVWNVSPRMAEGREKFLGISAKKYPQRFIPVGIWNKKIKKRSFDEIKKNQILFIGHLLEKQGVQMVLEALPDVMQKVGDVHLLVIGGGEYEEHLKCIIKKLDLEKNVTLKGWVTERSILDDTMGESAIAVATYQPEKEMLRNFTYFADPNKLKDYLGAGLPIVLTDISYNAVDIEKRGCGILVEYNKADIAAALTTLLQNKDIYKKYRANALQYADELDWMHIYDNVFEQ